MGAAKVWWTVNCEKHGMQDCKNMTIRRVKVSPPKHRRERNTGGCPRCRDERIKAEKLEKVVV
jgi:hypothetical protein